MADDLGLDTHLTTPPVTTFGAGREATLLRTRTNDVKGLFSGDSSVPNHALPGTERDRQMRGGRLGGLLRAHFEAVLTAIAFIVLHEAGLIADTNIWVLLGLIVVGAALRTSSERRLRGPESRKLNARLALGTATTGVIMYATGWGPVLAIGFVFTAAQNIKVSGSIATRPAIAWVSAGMAVGHLAIAAGLAPTLVPTPLVHGLAALGWLGTAFAIRLIGTSTRQMEQAEAQAEDSYRREHKTAEQLRCINSCLKAIASSMDLRQMLDAIALSTKQAFEAVFAAVLFADDRALLTGALTPGVARPDMTDLSRVAREAGPSATALATGEMVLVEDFEDPEDKTYGKWAEAVRSLGVRSMAIVPLKEEGTAFAVLNVYFAEPRRLTADEKALLQAFAEEATVAVARAQAFEQERAARVRLEELDELKDEFISTVSHELRTPLTAIGGFATTLVTRWPVMTDDVRLSLLDRINGNAGEMQALVEQLLDMSRLNKGHVELDPSPIHLRSHIDKALNSLFAEPGGRLFFVEVPTDVWVYADPDGLNRILMNLVTNAIKYSPASDPVQIKAERSGLDVTVSVIDQGPGIPLDEQERIFEPFFQGSGRKPGKSGTGIGLDIARRYVELHGGRIWVQSADGGGSTFSFTLPNVYSLRKAPPRRNPTPALPSEQ